MPKKSSCTFLTGATGLIGRYLMRDLLCTGHELCVLVRPSKKQSATQRIDQLLMMWERQMERSLPRPHVVAGEVTQPGLGLNAEARSWIKSNCNGVLHNAAILEFYGSDRAGEPWVTNLNGTENLLKVCDDLSLRQMHYVSTAYVSGDRAGPILEDEFACGQGFRNDYEESKFFAEKAVRDATLFDKTTIYRPAVVAGDSATGYTSTYHGLYLYLRTIAMMMTHKEPDPDGVRRFHLRWNCTGNEFRNIVPVDWVSAAMCRIFNTPEAHGGTYHLAPRNPITLRQLVDYIGSYFNSTGVEFAGDSQVSPEEMDKMVRDGHAAVAIYESYLTTDPRFDTRNTDRFTADIPCPDLDEATIHRFIRYGEEDRWGKRREQASMPRAPIAPSDLGSMRTMVGGNS
ncbi:MAG: Male sterility domain protein [Pirellula sp.]|nr:Male sterility domain protein [Pirellula sp.]